MKHHKSVTDKVIEANRRNAKKSTGPKGDVGKLAVRHNAVRHGLLAKEILFSHHEAEQGKFKHYLNRLERDTKPVGLVEQMCVEEIGTTWWKLQIATRWELKGIRSQKRNSKLVVGELKGLDDGFKILDSDWEHSYPLECETLVLRSTKSTEGIYDRHYPTTVPAIPSAKGSYSNQNGGGTEIEATLKSPLPPILRYQAGLKRDFYKAIDKLEALQRRRKESERKKHRRKRRHHS